MLRSQCYSTIKFLKKELNHYVWNVICLDDKWYISYLYEDLEKLTLCSRTFWELTANETLLFELISIKERFEKNKSKHSKIKVYVLESMVIGKVFLTKVTNYLCGERSVLFQCSKYNNLHCFCWHLFQKKTKNNTNQHLCHFLYKSIKLPV